MERIFKLNFFNKFKKNIKKNIKDKNTTEDFLKNNIEELEKLLFLYSSFDTYGLSYKDVFKYEIFRKPEQLKKNIGKTSIVNLNYELDKGDLSENVEILLIFLLNFIENNLNIEINELQEDLKEWYVTRDPLNIDTSLKMAINSNTISIENNSNNWLNRILFFLVLFRTTFSKEDIKYKIYKLKSFTNNNELSNESLDLIIDLVYESEENLIYELNKDYIDKYILNNNKIENNDINNSIKIVYLEYFNKNNNEIEDSIKNIIISNFDSNINLSSFILLKYNQNNDIFNNFEIKNYLNDNSINFLKNYLNKL